MKRILKKDATRLGKMFNINFDVISFDDWWFGLNVELEHGKKFGRISNITNDNLKKTAGIVIAHLQEFPDYYTRLKKLEERADKYWSKRDKPSIFVYEH